MIHIANDGPAALRAQLQLTLYRYSQPVGTRVAKMLTIDAASTREYPAVELFEGFVDLSYAYRFGPPSYEVLHLSLRREQDGAALADTFHFPLGLPNTLEAEVGLSASAAARGDDAFELNIRCKKFAQSVHVEVPGFIAEDQYFHMAPQSSRTLALRPRTSSASGNPQGSVHALNAAAACRISMAP